MSNEQMALLAACVFLGQSASGGYHQPTIDSVLDTADRFKTWLTEHEEEQPNGD